MPFLERGLQGASRRYRWDCRPLVHGPERDDGPPGRPGGTGDITGNTAAGVLYGLVMVAIIVGVDLLFLRGLPWARLASKVGIVLIFGAFYVRFFSAS